SLLRPRVRRRPGERHLMSWHLRYRIHLFFADSMWFMPMAGLVLGIVCAKLCWRLDAHLQWFTTFDAETYRSILTNLAAAVFTLIVFASSALLIALQLASAQLTPRIIAFLFRDGLTKWVMTLFLFTFTF